MFFCVGKGHTLKLNLQAGAAAAAADTPVVVAAESAVPLVVLVVRCGSRAGICFCATGLPPPSTAAAGMVGGMSGSGVQPLISLPCVLRITAMSRSFSQALLLSLHSISN